MFYKLWCKKGKINVSSVCVVVLNLFSYVTDCNYPAMYGVLSLIDGMCLHQEGFPRQKPVKKDSTTMVFFLKKYGIFYDDQEQQTQEFTSVDEELT